MEKYYIKSEDWKKIYAFLKTRQDVRAGNEGKTRTFGEAVYFIIRTGAQVISLSSFNDGPGVT